MTRRRAVAAAGFSGDDSVARAGLDDPQASVREAALRSLERLGSLDEATLGTALQDPATRVRIAAVELAAPRTGPSLTALLADDDARVVEVACWGCGERTSEADPPVHQLSDLARHHTDALVREAAVAALGAIGRPAGLAAVLQATTDKPAVRRRAVLALAAFEGPEVDAAWAHARSDRDRQVRDAVDELLGPAEDPA